MRYISFHNFNSINTSIRIILVFIVTCFLIFLHLKYIPYSFDDSYIHFRIAKHFVDTGYPYYNIGEPVMASSSTAWTIILFLLFSLFGAAQEPVAILNAVSCVIGAAFFYQLFHEINPEITTSLFHLTIPLIYLCALLPASIGLMETSISMVVFGFALLLFAKKRDSSIILFGTLPFFRIEFILFVGPIILYILAKKSYRLIVVIRNLIIGALPFLLYGFIYFGTIIPNSIIAKSNGYIFDIKYNILILLSYIFPPAAIHSPLSIYHYIILQLILISIVLITLVVTIRVQNKNSFDLSKILLLNGLLVCVFYLVFQSIIFPWYSPIFMVPLMMGAIFIFIKEKLLHKLVLSLFILPMVISTGYSVIGITTDQFQYVRFFNENARVAKYIALGKKLYLKYPNAVLATSEIGGLGWGFEGYIADGFGLASPSAIKYQDKRKNGTLGMIASEYIREIEPELIVSMDNFDRLLWEDSVLTNYQYFTEPIYLSQDEGCLHSKTLWGATRIDVFIRNDLTEESK